MLVFLFTSVNVQAQFLKEFYEDFLKYGTVYAAGDIQNAYESSRKEYFVERPQDGNIYDIPRVIEVTEYYPFDYRIGLGIRKLGRFDYERKPGNFWTGNQNRERQIALSTYISVKVLNTYSIGKKKGTEVRFGTTQDILLDTQQKSHC